MIEEKLELLGLKLPPIPKPLGAYVPIKEANGFLFLSGVLPKNENGIVYQGKIGADLNLEQGYEAGKLCALNALSVLKDYLGDLNRVKQIIKLVGYIQSDPYFYEQAAVLNGCSELLGALFGDAGKHARVAVGVSSLPGNAACEVELTLQV